MFPVYVDPVGTSRFAAVPNDIVLQVVPDKPHKVVITAPRLLRPRGADVPATVRIEDRWGNTITDSPLNVVIHENNIVEGTVSVRKLTLPKKGWGTARLSLRFAVEGDYLLSAAVPGSMVRSL